jgi:hypothetical protein
MAHPGSPPYNLTYKALEARDVPEPRAREFRTTQAWHDDVCQEDVEAACVPLSNVQGLDGSLGLKNLVAGGTPNLHHRLAAASPSATKTVAQRPARR